MRNRNAWFAAIAAALGVSEAACRREAAPAQVQEASNARASSSESASVVADVAPTASAESVPSASAIASAAPSASASAKPLATAKLAPTMTPSELAQAVCGAVPQNLQNLRQLNASCGASANPSPNPNATVPRVIAVIATTLSGNAAGDDRVVAMLRPRFRACANQGLTQDPSMQGKLVIVAKIAANGEVDAADVASNAGLSPASAQCMARSVRNAQFPAGTARTIQIAIVQTKQSP